METPIDEARKYIQRGEPEFAIKALQEEILEDGQKCRAAFYLLFLDARKDEYLEILDEPVCKSKYPLNNEVFRKYLSTVRLLKMCRRDCRLLREKNKKLSNQIKDVKKESERLNFELKKLEQIRRETEKLRLKK